MARAISIDHAAKGFLRHRFVRALAASWLVLIVATWLILLGYVLATQGSTGAISWVGYSLGVLLVLFIFFIPVMLITAVGGAVIDLLHRRLVALCALAANGIVLVIAPVLVLFTIAQLAGLAPLEEGVERSAEWARERTALTGLCALSGLIAWESAAWALWQLTTAREGFLAARGWRPPVWRLFSTFRRHLGLPSYISNFGRGRFILTLVYFGEALLNTGVVALFALPIFIQGDADQAINQTDMLAVSAVLAALFLLNLFRVGRVLDWIADRAAARLYQNVREWDARPPIVFLRAFDQDAAKLPAFTRDPLVKFPAGVGSARTLDEILLEHASPYGPVIAIGDPRDPTPPLGAARVFAPGEGLGWQEIVTALVGASKAVAMCPNDTEGVKWELDLIARAGGRVRAIYLANPDIPPEKTAALFARLAPDGGAPEIPQGQTPIAAYTDPREGWRVLTTSLPPCVQTYTIALNMALRALFGEAALPRRFRAVERGADVQQRRAA